MVFLYIILIVFYSIKPRTYDTIEEIYNKINNNIHELSLDFIINGTNEYSYYLKSENILYYFNNINISEEKKQFIFHNQHIKIIFNLIIYENSSLSFDFSSKEVMHSEMVIADLSFKFLKFYKKFKDFSFDFNYKIDNFDDDILLHFEKIDNLNLFRYLLFDDINEIYGNQTLFTIIKKNIIHYLVKEIHQSLVYYPECDSLNYFKKLVKYFINRLFFLDYKIYGIGYYFLCINKCIVSSFKYGEITKENKTIIFKNINVTTFLVLYEMDPDDYDYEILIEETRTFIVDYISIDPYMKIEYGKTSGTEEYPLEALKLVINKTINILEEKSSK